MLLTGDSDLAKTFPPISITAITVSTFDTENRPLEEMSWQDGSTAIQYMKKDDDNKNMVFRANRNRKGVLSEFIKTTYDDKGQVIRQNISGKYAFVFEYDTEGRTVLEERYLPNDELEYQSRFEYDEDGRMTKEVNLMFTKTYKYEYFD